jgi:hypothetical protein
MEHIWLLRFPPERALSEAELLKPGGEQVIYVHPNYRYRALTPGALR